MLILCVFAYYYVYVGDGLEEYMERMFRALNVHIVSEMKRAQILIHFLGFIIHYGIIN